MKQSKHNKTRYWDERRGVIRTQKGGSTFGQGAISHGYSVLGELLGDASFFQVLILNVTGRLPERRLAEWVEGTFICMSWPDPRIWCNQIGTLGGTLRASPVAAITAGSLASDSHMYGPGTALSATRFITQAKKMIEAGYSVEQLIEKEGKRGGRLNIPGYARPIIRGDERVEAMQKLADALGFKVGLHLALAYEIQEILLKNYGESLNLAGYMTAFLSDQGFTAQEVYRTCSLCVNGGVHACYSEAADRAPESFLPLRCDDIEYQGEAERPVPCA
jgi:hypothetical protein